MDKLVAEIVSILFKWERLREEIFREVDMYDMVNEYLSDPEMSKVVTGLWPDIDGWRGWSYSDKTNKYYFNDIPEQSFIKAGDVLDEMELAND